MTDTQKPKPMTFPEWVAKSRAFLAEAEQLADSDDPRAASVGRKARWLREHKPKGA